MNNPNDLRYEIERLGQRLEEMERRQQYANSRIRQDINSVLAVVVAIIGIAGIAYSKWPAWCYFIFLCVGVPLFQSWLCRAAQNQEEPK